MSKTSDDGQHVADESDLPVRPHGGRPLPQGEPERRPEGGSLQGERLQLHGILDEAATPVDIARSELRNRYVRHGSQGYEDSVVLDLLEKFIDAKVEEHCGPKREPPLYVINVGPDIANVEKVRAMVEEVMRKVQR